MLKEILTIIMPRRAPELDKHFDAYRFGKKIVYKCPKCGAMLPDDFCPDCYWKSIKRDGWW